MSADLDLPSAADIARHDAKRPVEPGEDQFLVGGFSLMDGLHKQIVDAMEAKGITWTQVAHSLGRPSRQALVASTKRRLVFAPRLREICALIDLDPHSVVRKDFTFDEMIRLGIPSSPLT